MITKVNGVEIETSMPIHIVDGVVEVGLDPRSRLKMLSDLMNPEADMRNRTSLLGNSNLGWGFNPKGLL